MMEAESECSSFYFDGQNAGATLQILIWIFGEDLGWRDEKRELCRVLTIQLGPYSDTYFHAKLYLSLPVVSLEKKKEKEKDTISGAKMLCYLNEGAISSTHFVHALSARAGLGASAPSVAADGSGMAPGMAEGQHCPTACTTPSVGLGFGVFIQPLCSCWLWWMRPEWNLDLCCCAEERRSSHHLTVFPTVSPAPWQVTNSGSKDLLVLLLWHFAGCYKKMWENKV